MIDPVIAGIIAEWPETFMLREWPNKTFRVNKESSYVSPDYGPQIVLQIWIEGDSMFAGWTEFCRTDAQKVFPLPVTVMYDHENIAEIDDLAKRIEALCSNPYWTASRRWTILSLASQLRLRLARGKGGK
jgi:hypothetical protein